MKNQALFSSKDKSKTLKCCLLQYLFGALRANLLAFQSVLAGRACSAVNSTFDKRPVFDTQFQPQTLVSLATDSSEQLSVTGESMCT